MACEEACPLGISPLELVLSLRQERVLDAGKPPSLASNLFRNLEQRGNPWGLPRRERRRWSASLGLPLLNPGESWEGKVLLWVGCMGTFDEQARRAVRAFIRLARAAGVELAVLAEEGCCGDPARRLGNERLWYELAQENIATLQAARPEHIVSLCPHCVNALANEYTFLGADLPAIHASTFLAKLLQEGRLPINQKVWAGQRATYHDPCYLGRGNTVLAPPRELMAALGINLLEPKHHGNEALCCGAGGGQMWLGSKSLGTPLAQEIIQTEARTCLTACPYCAKMLTEELSQTVDEPSLSMPVLDLVEALAQALPDNPEE